MWISLLTSRPFRKACANFVLRSAGAAHFAAGAAEALHIAQPVLSRQTGAGQKSESAAGRSWTSGRPG